MPSGTRSRTVSYVTDCGSITGRKVSALFWANRMVWPSFFAWTTALVPSAPPAPGRLVTATDVCSVLAISSASRRTVVSAASPGASGTTILIGPFGKVCAGPKAGQHASRRTMTSRCATACMGVSCGARFRPMGKSISRIGAPRRIFGLHRDHQNDRHAGRRRAEANVGYASSISSGPPSTMGRPRQRHRRSPAGAARRLSFRGQIPAGASRRARPSAVVRECHQCGCPVARLARRSNAMRR